MAAIEVGRNNSYGHPSQYIVKRLQDSGAKIYSTASSGSVRVVASRTGYTVNAEDGTWLPVTVPGGSLPPTGLEFDDLFEDMNGNKAKDFADIIIYFNQMSWITANEPVSAFDYNGNGGIDFADVIWLFTNL